MSKIVFFSIPAYGHTNPSVPSILFPLHSEQVMVANRVAELNAGIRLKSDAVSNIKKTVTEVLNDKKAF